MTTQELELESQRYPVGRFRLTEKVTPEQRKQSIDFLESLPRLLRQEVEVRGEAGLERPYRPGGWTLRRLIHHLADSHHQASSRMRLALTEDWPMIKAYNQEAWARLEDATSGPVEPSLAIIDGLHARWALLLRSVKDADWSRGFDHPENGRERLDQVLLRYEWHGRHHLAHARAVPRS